MIPDLRKLPPEHHAPTKKRHALPLLLTKDDDSGSSDESDSGPDNEVANERTFAPPARYPDHFLDYAAEPLVFQTGPPPDVDFIGIKHHFSNATNLAFPAYAHANRRHGKSNTPYLQTYLLNLTQPYR